jgi:hypothetical protein
MSDFGESARRFLQRWSERKRVAEKYAPDGKDLFVEDKNAGTNVSAPGGTDLPAFDPATLPPIESITATSDIRAFLAPGVPQDLAHAALRRAWVTDPKIRDFVGIAENQWDFTKPDSVPGFGSLELTPELCRMVASLIGDAPEQTAQLPANVVWGKQPSETDPKTADQSGTEDLRPDIDRPEGRS